MQGIRELFKLACLCFTHFFKNPQYCSLTGIFTQPVALHIMLSAQTVVTFAIYIAPPIIPIKVNRTTSYK